MNGITTQMDYLTRANVWSRQLKDFFEDELIAATRYVDWLTEFPDGDVFNIPSVGQMQVLDYEEGQAVRYTGLATGNWTFSITDYKSAATYITDKAKQDLFYSSQLEASFLPKMKRALAVEMETAILAVPNAGQTASNLNVINGANHRFVGSGTNGIITVEDFARANYALKKANVPMTNLIALVDPSVELTINRITNLTNVSNNPQWHGIIESGIASGTRFVRNIYGFDVYTSNYLPGGITETIDSKTVTGDGVANYFFSAGTGGDISPWKGAVRQAPRVESERNKDLQRDEYVMTCRYGFGFYRPENLVTVLTDISAALV